MQPLKGTEKILIFKLGGLGDFLMVTPVVRALKETFPSLHLTVLGTHPGLQMLEHSPFVDEAWDFASILDSSSVRLSRWAQWGVLFQKLQKGNFDVFLSLQTPISWSGTVKPALCSILCAARRSVGLNTEGLGFYLTDSIPDRRLEVKHFIERYSELLAGLGVTMKYKQTEVFLTDSEKQFAAGLWSELHLASSPCVVGIHVGANPRTLLQRKWPEENFAEVADHLIRHYGVTVVLTGTVGEKPLVDRVASLMKGHAVTLIGRTAPRQLMAFIERCQLFISADTGPMHMGVACKVPTIGIFGPGDYQVYAPYPQALHFVWFWKEYNCWPCRDLKCQDNFCMRLTTTDEVIRAAEGLLLKTKTFQNG